MSHSISPFPRLLDLINRFQARYMEQCRKKGLSDGEVSSGWDAERDFDPEGSGWAQKVRDTIPNVEQDEMFLLHKLERDIKGLQDGEVGAHL